MTHRDITIVEAVQGRAPPATIAFGRSMQEGLSTMKHQAVSALAIVSPAGDFLGLLTEREIITGLARLGASLLAKPVEHLMLSDGPVARPYDTVVSVRFTMAAQQTSHIPVISGNRLLAILSIDELTAIGSTSGQDEVTSIRPVVDQTTL
jgi:CBS domain-containing protein